MGYPIHMGELDFTHEQLEKYQERANSERRAAAERIAAGGPHVIKEPPSFMFGSQPERTTAAEIEYIRQASKLQRDAARVAAQREMMEHHWINTGSADHNVEAELNAALAHVLRETLNPPVPVPIHTTPAPVTATPKPIPVPGKRKLVL